MSPHMGLCCFIIYQASISSSYKHGTFKLEYGMRNKKRDQRVSTTSWEDFATSICSHFLVKLHPESLLLQENVLTMVV